MTLIDASPLVAIIDATDENHELCVSVLPQLRGPLVTTWACFTEAMYLLGRTGNWYAQDKLWQYVRRKAIQIHCQDMDEQVHMQQLMQQYRDCPMDLADASLVVLAETLNQKLIFTLDSDFLVYRFKGKESFELIPQMM